jgi:hypothetical protein
MPAVDACPGTACKFLRAAAPAYSFASGHRRLPAGAKFGVGGADGGLGGLEPATLGLEGGRNESTGVSQRQREADSLGFPRGGVNPAPPLSATDCYPIAIQTPSGGAVSIMQVLPGKFRFPSGKRQYVVRRSAGHRSASRVAPSAIANREQAARTVWPRSGHHQLNLGQLPGGLVEHPTKISLVHCLTFGANGR